MLNILLADADAEHIRYFQRFIKSSLPEVKIVGSLSSADSRDIFNLTSETRPNLILADIRFFGTSLVKTIRTLFEFFPETRFILYGNFNDAEYIEQVAEYGLIDRLYRPVKPAELEKSLRGAIKIFEEITKVSQAHKRLVTEYTQDISLFRDRFLNNLLYGYLNDEYEIQNSFNYFNIKLTPGYTVFTLRIDEFKKIILSLDEMGKHLLVYQILLIIKEKILSVGNGAALINRLNSISVILGGSMELADIISLCEAIKEEVTHQTKFSVTIGIGRTHKRAADIAISANEAAAALRYRFVLGRGTVIPIDFAEPLNTMTYRYPKEKEEALVYSAVLGEYGHCRQLFGQIMEILREEGERKLFPNELIVKIFMSIILSISRLASEQNLVMESKINEFFPPRQVFGLKNLDEAQDFFLSSLESFCAYMITLRAASRKKILEKAKKYINDNYFLNISPAKVATFAETTNDYLNAIFIDEEKKSVYEYAVLVRINNAKKMMRETDLPDDVIAVNVGYGDVKYFRSVFKQKEGCTTSEYRVRSR